MILKTPDGIELFYETYGEKGNAPVILVHGAGADHEMWLPQIAKYPAEGLFVIALDIRGHGDSSKVKSFKISDCAKDVNELLAHLGITKATLIGVSMGGLIIQQFAVDFPEKVDKLVIADSFSATTGVKAKINAWLAAFGLKALPKAWVAKSFELAYKGADKEHVRRYFREAISKTGIRQARFDRDEANRFNILDRLGEVRVPTLVLVGDSFGEWFVNLARETAKRIKGAQFKVLNRGQDPSNLVVPDLFDNEVLNFIGNADAK